MTVTLFTIGTQGRRDDDFVAVLKQHQIDAVIVDVRPGISFSPRLPALTNQQTAALTPANWLTARAQSRAA
jgi:hypothetical protein